MAFGWVSNSLSSSSSLSVSSRKFLHSSSSSIQSTRRISAASPLQPSFLNNVRRHHHHHRSDAITKKPRISISSTRRDATVQDREYTSNTTSTSSSNNGSPKTPQSTTAAGLQPLPDKFRITTTATTTNPHHDRQHHLLKTATSSSINDNYDIDNWKEHPDLNPTLTFPTWAVPIENASIIQTLLSSELTQPFLASRNEIIQLCHPRPKLVQDYDNVSNENDENNPRTKKKRTHKYILLHSQQDQEEDQQSTMPPELIQLLQQHNVDLNGPKLSFSIRYHQLPFWYLLEKLLPPEVHPPPTAFETVGHVAHLNLKEHHLPYAKLIGTVLLECVPTIETVIQKIGQVDGPYRTYNYELLAGRNDTNVQLQEHGIKLHFDLSKVYWCSRLAQERQTILDLEVKPNQVIADAFCGVGAICLRAAQTKQCTVLANDWNRNAVEYLEHNFLLNGLDPYLAAVTNQDAYDFLMDLGFEKVPEEEMVVVDDDDNDDQEISPLPALVADHILLNFPLKAPTFLGALRWWSPPLSESSPRLHVYTFARADDNNFPPTSTAAAAAAAAADDDDQEEEGGGGGSVSAAAAATLAGVMGRTAEEVAVDMIAEALLPVIPSSDNDGAAYRRRKELDEEFGCETAVREVRDVAPGKIVFCVSFTATPKLIRHMQGDFDDDDDDDIY